MSFTTSSRSDSSIVVGSEEDSSYSTPRESSLSPDPPNSTNDILVQWLQESSSASVGVRDHSIIPAEPYHASRQTNGSYYLSSLDTQAYNYNAYPSFPRADDFALFSQFSRDANCIPPELQVARPYLSIDVPLYPNC